MTKKTKKTAIGWPITKSAIDSALVFKRALGPIIPERGYNETSNRSYAPLIEMLAYRRASNSKTIRAFEKRFLRPVFGNPDSFGNYILSIGDKPDLAFMAHYDSVHRKGGIQRVTVTADEWCKLHRDEFESDCLGADCATGIYLILEMIKAEIPGLYIIHSEEESGCIGSRALVKSNPDWLSTISAAISFDRKTTESIITHQSAGRTASDEFAKSLASILRLDLCPDPTGSFTDSNEYADDVPECTNLSVGYYSQHTSHEIQDLRFAAVMADRLIEADWSQIEIARKPGDFDLPKRTLSGYSGWWSDDFNSDYGTSSDYGDSFEDMVDMIQDYPELVADLLERLGIGPKELAAEIGDSIFATNYKGAIQ